MLAAIKALITVEGAARGLHGDFDMEAAARSYVGPLLAVRYGPMAGAELLWRMAALTALHDSKRHFNG